MWLELVLSPLFILLATSAWAGPHTVMLGVEGNVDTHAASLHDLGATRTRCYRVARICIADFADSSMQNNAVQHFADHPGVRWVERDQPMPVVQHALTDDHAGTPDCPDLWELPAVELEAAFDLGLTGAGAPVVAIQDTGFYEAHEDFGVVSGRYDYGNWDTDPEVEYGAGVPQHGTFIAGIINGVADNELGRAGVLPDGRVNLQKIADNTGALYFSYAVSAMADIAEGDLGVRVLNYSIGGSGSTTAFEDAVSALADADILLVAAAANCGYADCADADNDAYPIYPASYSDDHIIAVAGSTRDGALNPYSHYGAWSVDLAAPGVDICSLDIDSTTDTATAGGTSYATPIVAAAAALIWEASPDLTAVEVARVLRVSTAHHADLDGKVRSGGNLHIGAALATAVPRLDGLPADLLLDGSAAVGIDLANVAAEGTGTIVLTHAAALTIEPGADAPAGWTATPFSPGDTIVLPDAGSHPAVGHGTILTGPLAARSSFTLSTVWTAAADGESDVTVRLVATSDGADYLNAPYNTGSNDETGFLALSSHITFTAADPGSEDTAEPDDTAEPEDTGHGPLKPGTPGDPGKGGCSAVGTLSTSWLTGLLLLGWRRRS